MTAFTGRTIPTTVLSGRPSIARRGSFLCDRLGNQICDRLGNPFVVYDQAGSIELGGTVFTGRIIPS